jgi:hypothetical protein
MTPPVPPTPNPTQPSPYSTAPADPNTIAAMMEVSLKSLEAAELRLKQTVQRHRVLLVCVVIAVLVGGWRAYIWHLEHMATLEATAHLEKTKATNEHKLGVAWRARYVALTGVVKHDTVRVRQLIHDVKTITVQVPMVPAAAQDGVTYSDSQPLVPMDVVSKLDYDSLGEACERVNHDCGAALAASDSARAHADSMAAALARLNRNTEERLASTKRIALVEKGGIAAFFYVLGRLIK